MEDCGEASVHRPGPERPGSDRPRERLVVHGAGALSEAELVALLLRTGTPPLDATALA